MIERSKQYIAAAAGLGDPAPRIVVGQLAPNVTSQIIVQASMNLPYAIIDIAGLSFLSVLVYAANTRLGVYAG